MPPCSSVYQLTRLDLAEALFRMFVEFLLHLVHALFDINGIST